MGRRQGRRCGQHESTLLKRQSFPEKTTSPSTFTDERTEVVYVWHSSFIGSALEYPSICHPPNHVASPADGRRGTQRRGICIAQTPSLLNQTIVSLVAAMSSASTSAVSFANAFLEPSGL